MVTYHSGITWFEEEDWIGREIVFDSPVVSRWKVTEKIKESGDCEPEASVKEWNAESSCRGVFACSSLDHPGKEAVVKIRMQVPWWKTAHKAPHKRAAQALPGVRYKTELEVQCLQSLTAQKCSSTPALFAWKSETQGDDGWVPGGFIDYILMERLPGSTPLLGFTEKNRKERDELRKALKIAWMECTACGVINLDSADRNIVWDCKNQKCYLVDWEWWRESTDKDVWRDTQYIFGIWRMIPMVIAMICQHGSCNV